MDEVRSTPNTQPKKTIIYFDGVGQLQLYVDRLRSLLPAELQHFKMLAHQLVQPYFADRSDADKDRGRAEFSSGKCQIIGATEAFGMGMNNKDIWSIFQVKNNLHNGLEEEHVILLSRPSVRWYSQRYGVVYLTKRTTYQRTKHREISNGASDQTFTDGSLRHAYAGNSSTSYRLLNNIRLCVPVPAALDVPNSKGSQIPKKNEDTRQAI
jgi:hypothetical protein